MQARWREVLGLLESEPDGLTSREISERLRVPIYTITGVVSKMACYGAIDKLRDRRKTMHTRMVWKAKPKGNGK